MRFSDVDDEEYEKKKAEEMKRIIIRTSLIVVGVVILLILIFGSVYIVSAGERAVILTWGKADPIAIEEGLHFKIPIMQKIVKMDVRTQKYVVEKASAASKDLQIVTADVTLNYYIKPTSVPTIYTKTGVDYQDKVITPAVLEVVKASTAQYTAEELITKRPEIKDKIDMGLRERLNEFNVIVQAVSITNFDFSAQFNSAIESKVTAEQNALAAKNKLAQVEYEAKQRITQATAEAEAIKIQASAIQSQGGKDYVALKWVEKWDGHQPQIVLGAGSTPLINIGTSGTGTGTTGA